ncbi:MAG: hypothetical protein MZV63_05830 [Marinilabiliales bacterium]|nr:hypothetical protein [Marinilabiliales bacterium]
MVSPEYLMQASGCFYRDRYGALIFVLPEIVYLRQPCPDRFLKVEPGSQVTCYPVV